MKLAYLTASFPYGNGESFVSTEVEFHLNKGDEFVLFPLWARGKLSISPILKKLNLIILEGNVLTFKMFLNFILFMILKPRFFFISLNIISKSKVSHFLKNLIILPKVVYISNKIKEYEITHLHVHWGATTSTAGMIAAKISNIKWSFTCHRWDIYENNLLQLKSESAEFVRFISDRGKTDAINLGVSATKATLIHMGVEIPQEIKIMNYEFVGDPFNIMCPANLIDVKGHFYLIEAVKYIKKRKNNVKLYLAGDGPLREQLKKQVVDDKLEANIVFLGQLSHEELLNYYINKNIHCVVLPSIDLGNGLHEGIPVSLMEGMAYGKLVISTKTGSIPELLPEVLNVTTDDKDHIKIAQLLMHYIENPLIYRQKCIALQTLIASEWSVGKSMDKLVNILNCRN